MLAQSTNEHSVEDATGQEQARTVTAPTTFKDRKHTLAHTTEHTQTSLEASFKIGILSAQS